MAFDTELFKDAVGDVGAVRGVREAGPRADVVNRCVVAG